MISYLIFPRSTFDSLQYILSALPSANKVLNDETILYTRNSGVGTGTSSSGRVHSRSTVYCRYDPTILLRMSCDTPSYLSEARSEFGVASLAFVFLLFDKSKITRVHDVFRKLGTAVNTRRG